MEVKEIAQKVKKLLLPAPCGRRISVPLQLAGCNLQLIAIKGRKIGPTVLIRGTLQGLENAGAVACLALSHELEQLLSAGKLIFCLSEQALEPAAREAEHWKLSKPSTARRHSSQLADVDKDIDINKVKDKGQAADTERAGFGLIAGAPANKNGQFWQFDASSFHLAAFTEFLAGIADYFIDLRSCGDSWETLPHAAVCGLNFSQVSEIERTLSGLHLQYILRTEAEECLLAACAVQGIPAVSFVSGTGGPVQTAAVQLHKNNVRLLLAKLGMLKQELLPPAWEHQPTILTKQRVLKFPCNGTLKTYLPPGTILHQNDVLLRMTDGCNGRERCLHCPMKNGVLLKVCTALDVSEQTQAVALAAVPFA